MVPPEVRKNIIFQPLIFQGRTVIQWSNSSDFATKFCEHQLHLMWPCTTVFGCFLRHQVLLKWLIISPLESEDFSVFIQKSLHLVSTYTLHFMEHSNPSYPFLEHINLFPNISNILYYLNKIYHRNWEKTKTIADLFVFPSTILPFTLPNLTKNRYFLPPPPIPNATSRKK